MADMNRIPAAELENRIRYFLDGYYLIGVWRDRQAFYEMTPEELKAHPFCLCGQFLCFVMEGKLEKAGGILQVFNPSDITRLGMELVYPCLTIDQYVGIISRLKNENRSIPIMQITAGRPSVMNGVMDLTRLYPFLERKRELFIESMSFLYKEELRTPIYKLCLAEYYYQVGRLMESGTLVVSTIKEFDNDQQCRLLFAALYLQTKLLFASGKMTSSYGYIKNIRRFVRKVGEQEFSYNINAAEAYTALYEGNYELASNWLSADAPDEFSAFCMLDLYRYMVKIRCYIVNCKYMAVLALSERLRPLLEKGNRIMDLCELDLLLAISFYRTGEKELAFAAMDRVIKIARRRSFYRLIEDEGAGVLPLLVDYIKVKGQSPFLMNILEGARDMAAWYPLYLKPINKGGVALSKMELSVLKFLEHGNTKEEIAECFFVSVNTIKFHMKNIYKKLGCSSALQAVWEARLIGVI